jgi:hypothetical protein
MNKAVVWVKMFAGNLRLLQTVSHAVHYVKHYNCGIPGHMHMVAIHEMAEFLDFLETKVDMEALVNEYVEIRNGTPDSPES